MTPTLAPALLATIGTLSVMTWMVADAAGGRTARVAFHLLLLLAGASLISGALMLP